MLKTISKDSSSLATVTKKVSSSSLSSSTTTHNFLLAAAIQQRKEQQLSIYEQESSIVSANNDKSTNNSNISNSSSPVCWSRALEAYYSAIFSGSHLRESHALPAIRAVVNNISKMPLHPASTVLSTLGCLSEESPLTYGPHCIEAVTNVASCSTTTATTMTSNEEIQKTTMITSTKRTQDSSLLPTAKRVKLLSPKTMPAFYKSPMLKAATETINRHRFTLVDSSQRIACKAVTNCMNEGRWEAAISIATQLPNLVRFAHNDINNGQSNNTSTTVIHGSTRTTCYGGSVHLGAYVEALNQAVQRDQQKAVSTLLQLIHQQRSHPRNQRIPDGKVVGSNKNEQQQQQQPTFYLTGLAPVDLKHMLLSFKQSEQGWRIASLLFSERKFDLLTKEEEEQEGGIISSLNSIKQSEDRKSMTMLEEADVEEERNLLLDPSVVNASLHVLGTQNRWSEATKILSLKVSHNNKEDREIIENPLTSNNSKKELIRVNQRKNSTLISTATRVLRQSPWNVALQLVSKLCCTVVDHFAAAEVAKMILHFGPNSNWEHAAAAFSILRDSSALTQARSLSDANNTNYYSSLRSQQATAASLTIEAILSSRLTVKLLNEGKMDLASRALRHVRATGDANALSGALNAFVLKSKSIQDCDTWITTMIEDGLAPSRNAREHVIRLFCQEGDWQQALCAVRDLDIPITSDEIETDEDESGKSLPPQSAEISSKIERSRIVSPLTHVFLQRSLKLSNAPWDVAVRTFIQVESGKARSFPKKDETSVQQVAEAFRSVVGICMEQKKEGVAQDLLSIMIQKGVGGGGGRRG